MDKFFATLMITVFSALIFSMVSMFQSNTNASTIENGVKILMQQSGKFEMNRAPAIVKNK